MRYYFVNECTYRGWFKRSEEIQNNSGSNSNEINSESNSDINSKTYGSLIQFHHRTGGKPLYLNSDGAMELNNVLKD